MMKVSIIIPCREINEITIKCIRECLNQDYKNFEIIVLPDNTYKKAKNKRLKIIETGKVKPGLKRNIGMENAEGEFYAFIDDDAYPRKDWIKNALKYFEDDKIGIVGGPNLTPRKSKYFEKISGYVLSNFFVLGEASIRYRITRNRNVKELPSCNYISRADISPKYNVDFLTAEDSKFCFDISNRGYKILYASDVIVYHHRRDSLRKHLLQMFVYGRDVALLTRKEFYIDKLYYFIPSFGFLIFILGLIGSFFNIFIKNLFLLTILIYLLFILFTSFHDNLKTSFLVFITSIGSHFAYALGWFKGILKLK